MPKQNEIIVTDKRLKFGSDSSEGSSALQIRDAAKQAEAVLDIQTHSLKDDAVFVPMGDRITVVRIPEVELSSKGIVIPQNAKNPPSFGVVVGVGQGRYNLVGQLIPCRVQKGAVVAFGKFAGSDLPLFGVASKSAEPQLILREEEIFGVIMSAEDYAKIVENADPEIVGVQK